MSLHTQSQEDPSVENDLFMDREQLQDNENERRSSQFVEDSNN